MRPFVRFVLDRRQHLQEPFHIVGRHAPRGAEVYGRMGETERGQRLAELAAARKQRFEEAFWMESERFYAIALDAHKRKQEGG